MQCAESLRVQAYFDGEVDAVTAADIERHSEHCSECRALLADLEQTRALIRRELTYGRTPPELHGKIMNALDAEGRSPAQASTATQATVVESAAAMPSATAAAVAPRRKPPKESARSWGGRSFWAGALAGVGGTAIAAAFAFLLVSPSFTDPLLDDLVAAHVRSLMPSHLIDVVSTDQHTVKPWFAGHADVSPAVADFASQGYRLIGGRADYFEHQRPAVVVYQHGRHVINVFSWAGNHALPHNTSRNGYHMAFWSAGNLQYCAVSDTGWDELLGLVGLLQILDARAPGS